MFPTSGAWPQDAWRGLNADLKRTLSGQLLPRGRIAWREEDAFV